MKKYIETRILFTDKLRRLCIDHDWYTCGDNDEYDALFARLYDEDGCHRNITTELLAEIAEDIWEHSEITRYTMTTVMSELARVCTIIIDEA